MPTDGLIRLSDVQDKPTEWLWPYRIPIGEITILEGHPGTNKSSLTIDLAARLSRGDPMPDAPTKRGPKRKRGTLFLIGEDSIEKTVRKRLVAAGADLDMIGVMDSVAIPGDIEKIKDAIGKVKAEWIVVDTLNDFLTCNVMGNRAVRDALRPLRELADQEKVAVAANRHFVKAGGNSLLRGGGSVGITGMARSQLKLFLHPEDKHLRVLCQDKSNLGPLSPSIAFEIVATDNGTFRLEWHGECDYAIEDLIQTGKGSPKLDAAKSFLLNVLADGPKLHNEIIGKANGMCSKRTLDEAKRDLDIVTTRRGQGKAHKVYWELPTPCDNGDCKE